MIHDFITEQPEKEINVDRKLSPKLLENVLILKECSLFCNVNTSELRAVSEIAEEVFFDKGQCVIKEGEKGNSLYLIKSGQVQIFQKSIKTGELLKKEKLYSGECFGEMAVIDEEIRTKTAVSMGDSIMLRINRDDLYNTIQLYPSIGIELFCKIVKMIYREKQYLEKLIDG